jgi:hypothetical protein
VSLCARDPSEIECCQQRSRRLILILFHVVDVVAGDIAYTGTGAVVTVAKVCRTVRVGADDDVDVDVGVGYGGGVTDDESISRRRHRGRRWQTIGYV